jgi:hypothetical protein
MRRAWRFRDAEAELIPQQELAARRLDWIDHWGKLLTVATVVYGFRIAVVYPVGVWQDTNRMAG